MPQASDEIRAIWHHKGGDLDAIEHLEKHGIKECCGLLFVPRDYDLTDDRTYSAIRYLLDEWDFGVEWIEPKEAK